ncbi:MAG: glycogen synthase GlgA [Candidatus Omnitrophica bacterium]|nr:glycogen synthase GlgA [Candidatus Omnitrophota bacterium]
MKIVFIASEMAPFAKTGGLADVTGSLPREIRLLGHEVIAFVPRYKSVDPMSLGLEVAVERLRVPMGSEKEAARIYKTRLDSGVDCYFIDHPEFFCRDALYGTPLGDYPDNDRRFTFFQRAVLETLVYLGIKSDILHCHDWQTGLIPVYLKILYKKTPLFQKTKTIFTIHNLAYQGTFPPDSLAATGFGWEEFRMERLEFYGKISFLKGGILDADTVTTVSERYAREILTPEFGCGLEGVLSKRKDRLHGVVNGIDPQEWDPEIDEDLAENYSLKRPSGKTTNKIDLQKENGLNPDVKIPLLGMVTRLADQKGMDIFIPAISALLEMGAQIVLLGTGEEKYHQMLRDIAKKNKGKIAVHILFDSKMAKRIYGGSDMMLFPSYYEPCGLGQMIALRFGTIPVVRATGGLADTIQEFDGTRRLGNGFLFEDYTSEALGAACRRALSLFRAPELWNDLIQNAMQCDFSWAASAKKYVKIYELTKRQATEGSEK